MTVTDTSTHTPLTINTIPAASSCCAIPRPASSTRTHASNSISKVSPFRAEPVTCKERFIHGEIYKMRPDVQAVVHTHAVEMILFSVLTETLRPIYQMSSFLGDGAPVFEIRSTTRRAAILLITDQKRGQGLAASLGASAVVLMRGHGASVVGSSLKEAIYRTIYSAQNARLQVAASHIGQATFLDELEIQHIDNTSSYKKAWNFWKERALRRWSSRIMPIQEDDGTSV